MENYAERERGGSSTSGELRTPGLVSSRRVMGLNLYDRIARELEPGEVLISAKDYVNNYYIYSPRHEGGYLLRINGEVTWCWGSSIKAIKERHPNAEILEKMVITSIRPPFTDVDEWLCTEKELLDHKINQDNILVLDYYCYVEDPFGDVVTFSSYEMNHLPIGWRVLNTMYICTWGLTRNERLTILDINNISSLDYEEVPIE